MPFLRFAALPALALAIGCALPLAATAQPQQTPAPPAMTNAPLPPGVDRAAIERIVREYLLQHPEVLVEAINELRRRQEMASADAARIAIAQQRKEIYEDAATPVAGNLKGDVTIVEFFDYHCGYCKQVQPSMESLQKNDPKLRFVFKELPILAPESRIAAAGALAAERQGKYLAMHNALMRATGKLSKERVLQIGKDIGLDVARLEKDMKSPEIDAAIERNLKLAAALDVNGTPAFLIGDQLVPGAIDIEEMKKLIAEARKG